MKIAYQGIEGSYSESCAKEIYPDCETISCKTFDDVFAKANNNLWSATVLNCSNWITLTSKPPDLLREVPLAFAKKEYLPIANFPISKI